MRARIRAASGGGRSVVLHAMLMLSHLQRYHLVAEDHPPRPIVDLVLGPLDVDYPAVTHLLARENGRPGVGGLCAYPWASVAKLDQAAREVRLRESAALSAAGPAPQPALWLLRDVLDALIIDLQHRRVTRANDLALELHAGTLRLRAVDTGARAIFRRLSRGRYQGWEASALCDWKDVEFLRGDPAAVVAGAGYHRRITHLPPGEIAGLIGPLPYLHAAELLMLLPPKLAADTLEVLWPERQLQVFEELEAGHALRVLEKMAPDVAADLVGRLPTVMAHRYLNRLPREHGERIVDLLRYPENTVGGIMTNDVIVVRADLTVYQARQSLRRRLPEPDFVYFLYVVDDEQERHLRGVLSLRDFVVADDHARLEEIMNPYVIALDPLDSPREAAYRLLASQLAALPVVSAEGRLLGAVTVDAAVSQVAPRAWSSQAPRVFS